MSQVTIIENNPRDFAPRWSRMFGMCDHAVFFSQAPANPFHKLAHALHGTPPTVFAGGETATEVARRVYAQCPKPADGPTRLLVDGDMKIGDEEAKALMLEFLTPLHKHLNLSALICTADQGIPLGAARVAHNLEIATHVFLSASLFGQSQNIVSRITGEAPLWEEPSEFENAP